MSKEKRFVVSVIVGLALLAFAGFAMWLTPEVPPALAQEEGWATPQGAAFGGGEWVMAPYINNVGVITGANQKYCSNGLQTAAYVLGDFQTIYTEHSDQIVTCTLEFSNDNTNWCLLNDRNFITHTLDGTRISCDELHMFGRYSRVCCWPGDVELFTITVRAKLFN